MTMSLSLIVNYRSVGLVLRVRSHGPASAQSRGRECGVMERCEYRCGMVGRKQVPSFMRMWRACEVC